MLWYLFIGCAIFLFMLFESEGPVKVMLFGKTMAVISKWGAVSVVLTAAIVGIWMYVVLCLPKIRAYFNARPVVLVDPALIRAVDRLEGIQAESERDVMVAQMGILERTISRLEELRKGLANLNAEQVISEARYTIDDLLARALRIRKAHQDGSGNSE